MFRHLKSALVLEFLVTMQGCGRAAIKLAQVGSPAELREGGDTPSSNCCWAVLHPPLLSWHLTALLFAAVFRACYSYTEKKMLEEI